MPVTTKRVGSQSGAPARSFTASARSASRSPARGGSDRWRAASTPDPIGSERQASTRCPRATTSSVLPPPRSAISHCLRAAWRLATPAKLSSASLRAEISRTGTPIASEQRSSSWSRSAAFLTAAVAPATSPSPPASRAWPTTVRSAVTASSIFSGPTLPVRSTSAPSDGISTKWATSTSLRFWFCDNTRR